MPAKAAIASLLLIVACNTYAQKQPLKGNGTVITKTFDYKNFDKLELKDIDGKINVEIGKPFSITIMIDDNLESLLKVKENDGELSVKLDGNENNKLYVEETNIKITITMPEISVLRHRSNSSLIVEGITGRYFRINNGGNGNATIKGSIDELNIVCSGNGTVRAEEMMAKSVKVNKSGNGNVYIKTDNSFTANGSGNGDVINKGQGLPDNNSSVIGNGEIKTKKTADIKEEPRKRVYVDIINQTNHTILLTVKYPGKGSYGIDVKAKETVKESFPVGTKLYKGNQLTTFKKVLYEVTDEDGQSFSIQKKD